MENNLLLIVGKLLKVSTSMCFFLLFPLLMVFIKVIAETMFVTVANGNN